MKIAHISILPTYSPGIFKKLEDKAECAYKHQLNIDFYLLNPVQAYTKHNLYLVQQAYMWIPTHFLKAIYFRLLKLYSVQKLIPLEHYDAIILRYPLVDGFGNRKFTKQYGHKLFTEHHSDEISELRAVGRYVDRFRGWIEKYFSANFLSNVKGIIAVTDEIRRLEMKKLYQPLPSVVIANGINPIGFTETGFMPFDGCMLHMLFIASEFAPWQGLECLLEALQAYQGKCQLSLHLVGKRSILQDKTIETMKKFKHIQIYCYGNLYGTDLDVLYRKSNIAISSLKLSAKQMNEACPLKSREYIVRGMPFIYAYHDTDLNGNETFAKYLLEDSVNIEHIIDFAHFVTEQKVLVLQAMKEKAKEVSWFKKLQQMQTFVRENL